MSKTKDPDAIWPPPPDCNSNSAEARQIPRMSFTGGSKLATAALLLSVPGAALALQTVTFVKLHIKLPALELHLGGIGYSWFVLVFVLPVFGFLAALFTLRTRAGQLALLCSIVDGIIAAKFILLDLG